MKNISILFIQFIVLALFVSCTSTKQIQKNMNFLKIKVIKLNKILLIKYILVNTVEKINLLIFIKIVVLHVKNVKIKELMKKVKKIYQIN